MTTTYAVRRITESGEVIDDFDGNPDFVAHKLVNDLKIIYPKDYIFVIEERTFEILAEKIGFRTSKSFSHED